MYGVKLDITSRARVVNAMKKSQAHFCIAAAIVSMFAALTVPAADGRRDDIDFYGLLGYASRHGGGQLRSLHSLHFNLDHAWMLRFGSAYHLTYQESVLTELAGEPNLRFTDTQAAKVPSITQTASYSNGRLSLKLRPLPEPSSYVFSAGIIFNDVRTVVSGASLQVYCQPGFFATYRWCATGVPTFEEVALFYNVDFGRRVDISRSAECEYRTPAGGLAYWIDDDILSLRMQPAQRFELPPDELRAFVQECDDAAEPEERLTGF